MIDSTSRLEFCVTGPECFVAQRNAHLTTYGDLVSLCKICLWSFYIIILLSLSYMGEPSVGREKLRVV